METLNLIEILEPISSELPCGMDLRNEAQFHSLYYQIRDLRQQARNAEKKFQLEETVDTSLTYWQQVLDLGIKILTQHSKDLEILAWLIEALLRIKHFGGLAGGFAVTAQMIELYWNSLFPLADAKDLSQKLAAFIGLNGEDSPGSLIFPLKTIPITTAHFAYYHYQRALEVEAISDKQKKKHRTELLGFTLYDIQQAVKQSSKEFYGNLLNDLQACLDNLKLLSDIFYKYCGELAPPTSYIRNALVEVLEHVQFLISDLAVDELVNAEAVCTIESTSQFEPTDKINDRTVMLKQLAKIADHFSVTEPHSPIPFLLHRAIRWGSTPLPQLFAELIADDNARMNLSKLTGIEF